MAPSRSIRHPLRRFAQVGGRQRALAVEATLYLAMARLALMLVPFPTLARRLGTLSPTQASRLDVDTGDNAAMARDVGWAVTRAARYLPFRAVCLPQALAARQMLRRRGVGSVLHFGAIKGATPGFRTHAWLDASGVDVTGYPVGADCTEIA